VVAATMIPRWMRAAQAEAETDTGDDAATDPDSILAPEVGAVTPTSGARTD
jgi:hypothetical protein